MNVTNALHILEIESTSPSIDEVRRSYLRLARIYHPDVRDTGDAKQFLLANAAYETLKRVLLDGTVMALEEEIDAEELETRIAEVNLAFEQIAQEFQDQYETVMQRVVKEAFETLASYQMASELYEKLEPDFEQTVNSGVYELTAWFDANVAKLTEGYDEWINSFLKETYDEFRQRELQNWYRSKFYHSHLVPSNA